MSIRLALDITRRDANVLFDIHTGQRMTFKKPACVVPFISEPVRISIRNGKVIDIDRVTGIEVRAEHQRNHDAVLSVLGIEREVLPLVDHHTEKGDGEVANAESEGQTEKDTDVDKAKEKKKNNRSKKEDGEK